LLVPSLRRTTSADSPAMTTLSTTTSRDSRGSSASEPCSLPMRAKVLSLFGSESCTCCRAIPSCGKTLSEMGPPMARVRPVFSLTARTMSGLYLSASKLAANTTSAMTASNTMATTAIRPTLSAFTWHPS